jgi:transketolase
MVSSLKLAAQFRAKAIDMSHQAKAAHLASALSCIDIVAVLFHSIIKINSKSPNWIDRDRFILSKGHAATALYAALEYKNFINATDISSYGQAGSLLEEHPSPKLSGVEAATGSLGHGLSIACGIALAGKIKKQKYRTFVLMSDGECNEGSVWEASLFAATNQLENLCAFIDFNKWQATGRNIEVLSLEPLAEKFRNFGWIVHEINGHDHQEILKATTTPYLGGKKPTMIVAHTIKGKGVSFMEDNNNWHYRIPTQEEVTLAKTELGVL